MEVQVMFANLLLQRKHIALEFACKLLLMRPILLVWTVKDLSCV